MGILEETAGKNAVKWEKVVVRVGSQSLRGYVESPAWDTIEGILGRTLPGSSDHLRVRLEDSETVEEIPIANLKAVFYVNSFEGDPVRNHINFHTRMPVLDGIWMRLEFLDGEVMEGIVHNSIRYLIEPGFFLFPTDPGSNNKLVYVFKKELVDHRILGLRKIEPSL